LLRQYPNDCFSDQPDNGREICPLGADVRHSGSGTSIIAAETCGRHCYAVELDPAYVDVAVRRWEAFTGGEAFLEADGRSLAQVALEHAERAGEAA